ncbi:unnamed protein product [Chironomus riparius]|uniref:Transcription termination factor 5, mitochondrial n=1 Tax=Chironomus riparius TaxID=315576 RepID=A0A9N9RSL0_9DIPT|nr:unnamed protein product [Chironomus riparius]
MLRQVYFSSMIIKIIRFSQVFNTFGRRFCSGFTSCEDEKARDNKFIEMYMKYLDLNAEQAKKFLSGYTSLWGQNADYTEIEKTLKYLRTNKFSNYDVIEHPTCLFINPATYENRDMVFKECLFQNVKLSFYIRYVSIMNKNLAVLKAYQYVHPSSDVVNNLRKQLDIPVKLEKELADTLSLNEIRREIMNKYLKERLHMTDDEIVRARKIYTHMKHRNLRGMVETVNILIDELNFSKERITKNSYLLHARAENIKAILIEIPKIAEMDIKEVVHARPKILMQNCETLKSIIQHVRNFNIPDEAIIKCHEILTLSSDTVYSRLCELHKVKEFSVMFNNPRILRLIHYQTKAKTRLEYLKQLKMRCFSLNLLSGPTETFEKYAYIGGDKTKGKEIIEFFSNTFKIEQKIVREMLHLHPHWVQVPVLSINNTMYFFRYKGFSKEDMLQNFLLLLYPISKIQPKLDALFEWKSESDDNRKISDVEVKTLSNSKLLSLCLYFIESEYHFTGNAIFEINKFDNKNDPSMIPDLPKSLIEKKYRFGTKESQKVAHVNVE